MARQVGAQQIDEIDMLSVLKVDNNGWNINLFEDESKMTVCICDYCKSVCRDAVELGCSHKDIDIFTYCNDCLLQLIKHNNGGCPISSHYQPMVIPSRSIRRQIARAMVICPYSTKYRQKNGIKVQSDVVDTIGDEQKEGVMDNNFNPNDIKGCEWKGTLNDLLHTDHLTQCVLKYDVSSVFNKLQRKITDLKSTLDSTTAKNRKLEQQLNEQSVMIQIFMQQIDDKNAEIQQLKQQIFSNKNESQEGASSADDNLKGITKTRKKLREIQVLEAKQKMGENLNKAQIAKMNRKQELTAKLKAMQNGTWNENKNQNIPMQQPSFVGMPPMGQLPYNMASNQLNQAQQKLQQQLMAQQLQQQLAAQQRAAAANQAQLAQLMCLQPAAPFPMQNGVPSTSLSRPASNGGGRQTSAPLLEVNPLTSETLKDAKPAEKKRLIGERLFPKIQVVEPRLAGKITGMLLEMDNKELLVLLSDEKVLMNKVNEALAVLKHHQKQNPGATIHK